MLHPQILGHALQRVGSPERGLPILGGQGVFQLAKAGVVGVLQHKLTHDGFAGDAAECVIVIAANAGVKFLQGHDREYSF